MFRLALDFKRFRVGEGRSNCFGVRSLGFNRVQNRSIEVSELRALSTATPLRPSERLRQCSAPNLARRRRAQRLRK